MIRTWPMQARILTGLLTVAGIAFPQAYTISAKPAAVSYVEGKVSVNGAPVVSSALRAMFLSTSDTLSTESGKAEVLLTPGVFLRVGNDTEVRMIAPSLVDMQLEILSGEAMIEVDQTAPGSTTTVIDHGSSTALTKTGLYRFTASGAPTVGVLEGKALVYFGAKKVEIGKNKQVLLTDELTVSKLDLTKADELYAWSNVRAQYDAGVTYQGAKSVYNNGGYGYGSGYQSAGLYWNNPYNSWMWLPGDGAFYSPFGWGFYGPGLVAYAPVVGYGYGYGYAGGGYFPLLPKPITGTTTVAATTTTTPPAVFPINPKRPPAMGFTASSPAAYSSRQAQIQQSIQHSGYSFHTATGGAAASLAGGHTYSSSQAAAHAAASSARASASSGSSGGGSSGGGAAAAVSSGSTGSTSASAHSMGSSGGHSSGGGRSR